MASGPYSLGTLPVHVKRSTLALAEADIALFVSTPSNASSRAGQPHPPPPLVLLVHGNSGCSLIWKPVFASPLAATHTIVAMDLPGHGASSDAKPEFGVDNVYTQRAYGAIARQVLQRAPEIDGFDAAVGRSVVFIGWSLGGHVGMELCESLRRTPDMWGWHEGSNAAERAHELANSACVQDPRIHIAALVLTGTPPVPSKGVDLGFFPAPEGEALVEYEHLTQEQITAFGKAMALAGGPQEAWMRESVVRTDGRARRIMFATFRDGSGVCDQRALVEWLTRAEAHFNKPTAHSGPDGSTQNGTVVAVINGAKEPFVNTAWIASDINWGPGLWRGKCIELDDSLVPSGHTPFWEDWDGYWSYLRDLVQDVAPAAA